MDFIFRRSYQGGVKAVIFDWSGTLVDFGCMAPAYVFVDVFKRHGVPITLAEAREPMGLNKREHLKAISQMDRVTKVWKSVHGKECKEEDLDVMYEDFLPMQLEKIAERAELIHGTLEVIQGVRERGIKIGTTTSYKRESLKVLLEEAKKQGFEPDKNVCADDVIAGRPSPWMAMKNLMEMQIYPFEACVKFGDTVPDIHEGLNAGMWSVGLVMAGNEIGMSEEELKNKDPKVVGERRRKAYQKISQAGAHFISDSIADVPEILDKIDGCLERGEKP